MPPLINAAAMIAFKDVGTISVSPPEPTLFELRKKSLTNL
jgi:hypothetical protein